MAVEKARRKTVRASAWVALGTALVLGIATLGTTDAATNLVWNASFERTGSTWLTPWTFSVKSGAAATIRQDGSTKTVGLYSANVAVTSTNGSRWLVQLSQGGIALTSGQAYRLEFSARVGAPRSIEATFQQSGSPYATYTSRSFSVGTSWVRYSHAFTAPVTQSNVALRFNLAGSTGSVWIDNVSVTATGSTSATASPGSTPTPTPTSTSPTPTPTPVVGAKGIAWYRPVEFWGTNAAGMLTDVVDMRNANVTWARVDLDPRLPLGPFDTLVEQAKAHGLRLLVTVLKTSPYLDLGSVSQRDAYKAWLAQMVNRYKGSVRHWEVMNEVNLHYGWNIDESTTSDQTLYQNSVHRYVVHLQDSYQTIKANDPGATVLIAGLSEWRVERYVDALLKEDACPWFDVMSFHPYGRDPDAVLSRFQALKTKLAPKACMAAKPIWVTETGFNTSIPEKAGYVTSEQLKADYLRESLLRLRAAGAQLPIFVFTLHGFNPGSSYGLQEKNATTGATTYFPAYWMYRDLVFP